MNSDKANLSAVIDKIQKQLAGLNVELAKRNAEISDLISKEAALKTTSAGLESDTKRAQEARSRADEQLTTKRSELDRAQIDLIAARSDLQLARSMRTAINVSEDDVQRALDAREKAEKAAIAAEGKLKDLLKQLNDAKQAVTSTSDKPQIDGNSPRE